MKQQQTPDWIHVFVCVNDRQGERASCADKDAVNIHAELKAMSKRRGWSGRTVRVSKSGCLGLCAQGPNVVLYPSKIHFARVEMSDLPAIEAAIEQEIEQLSAAVKNT